MSLGTDKAAVLFCTSWFDDCLNPNQGLKSGQSLSMAVQQWNRFHWCRSGLKEDWANLEQRETTKDVAEIEGQGESRWNACSHYWCPDFRQFGLRIPVDCNRDSSPQSLRILRQGSILSGCFEHLTDGESLLGVGNTVRSHTNFLVKQQSDLSSKSSEKCLGSKIKKDLRTFGYSSFLQRCFIWNCDSYLSRNQ